MKRIVLGIDGTLALPSAGNYATSLPDAAVAARLKENRETDFTFALHPGRNMRTCGNNLALNTAHTLPAPRVWLATHGVPCDGIRLGKPWCGEDGVRANDRAVRPAEYTTLPPDQLRRLLSSEIPAEGGAE